MSWWSPNGHFGEQVKPNKLQNGLILSGGGARAAYQVGVLMGVAELLEPGAPNPFPIVCGTSAGAINAAGLASRANNFRVAVRGLERAWGAMTPSDVFKTNLGVFAKELLRWFLPAFITGMTPEQSSLLNNSPLRRMLTDLIPFDAIQQHIDEGYLQAISVTASSYSSSESVAFFQGKESLTPWERARRRGEKAEINIDHLMASSALPVLFPAQKIGTHYYGDGAMRQLSPISPALHLGADRIMVIGVSGDEDAVRPRQDAGAYPSMAKVLGHVLNSVFVDTLQSDVERMSRINKTIASMPQSMRKENSRLREVELLTINPSESIDEIAADFLHLLPWRLRLFLRGPGGTKRGGSSAVSYLLFEPAFTEALMELGLSDARKHSDEISCFLQPQCELEELVESEPA